MITFNFCLWFKIEQISEQIMTSSNFLKIMKDIVSKPFPMGLTFLHILWADTVAAFVWNYLFKDACIAHNLEIQWLHPKGILVYCLV